MVLKLMGIMLAASCWAQGGTVLQTWEFCKGDLGGVWEGLREENSSGLPTWEKVELPHCFNATDAVNPYVAYYQGPGWYRRTLEVKNPYPDGRTLLRFDGAGQKTRVYVGDTLVGVHVGGYDEFNFDITDAVAAQGQDVPLLVRCDNSRDLEMIPSDLSDFNLYGGLYRPVHLEYRPPVSASWPRVDCSVDEKGMEGLVSFTIEALNPLSKTEMPDVRLTVLDNDGTVVVDETCPLDGDASVRIEATVATPELWSPAEPNLYSWILMTGAGTTDEHTQSGRLGFRHFRFEKNGPFYLNGERMLLRGTHRHEDHAGLGAAMTDALIRRELELMKSIGINFIRLGHYQQNRTVLELCDQLGILVWEEIPWCRGGLGGESYREQARRMLRNMIAQHRHHPSVIIWGLGNENDWPGDFETFDEEAIRGFMKELNEWSHELDSSRRTAIRRCAFCADIVDVYSPSIWAGWYRGKYTDYRKVSREEMEKVDRFLHVEWGASHHARRHSEDPDKGLAAVRSGTADERAGDYLMAGGEPRVSKDGDWTESYACNLIDWHLKEQEKMDWLTGTAYWPFKDFSTPIRPENPVPYVNQKGIVERDLTPKESFYVFQSYWTEEPMIRIYGHSWPVRWGAADEEKMVKVYSNCESVELFLNGKSLGRRERDSQDFPAAGLRWVTPFRDGQNTLRAVGSKDGNTVMDALIFECQTERWGPPAQLAMELIDETPEQAAVQVYALDKDGVRCLDAKAFVEFSLVGDGELIADLGTSITSRKVQLYNGRAQISILKQGGTSVVGVKSSGLPSAFLEVTPGSLPAPEPFVYRTVDGIDLRLHVVKPEGWNAADRRGCLIAFFGGGWNSGTPERSMKWAQWAAEQGLVGIAPDYRTRNRFGAVPEDCVSDGRAALRWVRAHAGELGIDARKIIVQGTSAGGHVAAWTAIPTPGPGKDDPAPGIIPAALILVNPVTDTKEGGYGGPGRFGGSTDRARACSVPDQMTSKMPPSIVFHATGDQSVPYANSAAFRDRMVESGNRCELVTFEGMGHSYNSESKFGEQGAAAAVKTYYKAGAFLETLGLIEKQVPPPAN